MQKTGMVTTNEMVCIDFQEKKQILQNLKLEEIPPSTNIEIIEELKSQISKEQMKLHKVSKNRYSINQCIDILDHPGAYSLPLFELCK